MKSGGTGFQPVKEFKFTEETYPIGNGQKVYIS